MHMLAFLYPNSAGHVFDTDHWRNVHLPLGLGLTDKYIGVRPNKVILLAPTRGGDLEADSAAFGAMAIVIFDQEKSVEKLSTLFEFEEAARRLSADFPNYAAGPPQILISEIQELTEIDAIIEKFKSNGG
ncbi:MAG TPA: hypothetical protein VJ859_12325 [Allosphingosinicella sp.]|nr:hypothetical protein [Allosphingosinicella sp.]